MSPYQKTEVREWIEEKQRWEDRLTVCGETGHRLFPNMLREFYKRSPGSIYRIVSYTVRDTWETDGDDKAPDWWTKPGVRQ